jgi:MFS family permease
LIALSLEEFGWRPTAFASGVLVILIGLPLVQLLRARPEDQGEVVDGERPAPSRHAASIVGASNAEEGPDFSLREAMRTPAFWLISLGHGSALLVVSAVSVHVISHLKEDLGYSVGAASLVVTLMTVFQIAGMLVGGFLGDRFDKRLIAVAGMAMHTLGLLLVAYAFMLPMVIGFSVLHGIAWGMRGPLMQAIRADYFGRRAFGLIMGVSSLIIMFGQIAGPLVAGSLADATGSYEAGFTVLAVLTGLGSAFFFLAKKPPLPDRPGARARIEAQPASG